MRPAAIAASTWRKGQAIDLNQEQPRLLACAYGGGKPEMANRPFVAA